MSVSDVGQAAMSTEILMPALSPTMQEGKITKWLIAEGEAVQPGDIIAEIETDQATMEVEAIDVGRVERILVPAGTERVKVNTPIALILLGGGASAPRSSTAQTEPQSPSPSRSTASRDVAPPIVLDDGPVSALNADMVETTMRVALRDAMAEEMRRDGDVLLMGEEVGESQGAFKVSEGLLQEFGPSRVIDTPITEQGFAGVGIGAAFAGLRPIVEFMTWNFAMQAIDQIVNSAAKTLYMSGGEINCPIVFRGPNGAASRAAGQHAQCFSAWYAHVPGLKVVAPSNPADAKGLLKAAIRDPNPVLVLESEALYASAGPVPQGEDWLVPIGMARIARPGADVTIVSFGHAMVCALEAADRLAADGIEAEVIDLRSLRPLDVETVLASVRKTNRIVTVEEAWPVCSVGSEICAQVAMQAFDDLDAPPAKISGADVPMPYAANLERLALPNAEQVVAAARAVLYRRS